MPKSLFMRVKTFCCAYMALHVKNWMNNKTPERG